MKTKNTALSTVEKFFGAGIEDVAKPCDVNDMSLIAFVKRRNVIDSAKSMLECLSFLCSSVHGANLVVLQTAHENFYTTRVFLTAYIIHYQLGSIFSYLGQEELSVIHSARMVLDTFNEMALIIKQTKTFSKVPADLAKRFNSGLTKYFDDFRAWESLEKKPRLCMVRFTMVSLYFTYFYHSKDADTQLRTVVSKQILELRGKCVEKYGQGVLDELDKDLLEGKFGMPPISTPGQLELLDADPKFFVLRNVDHTQLVHELCLDINYKTNWTILRESPVHVNVTLSRNDGVHWSMIHSDLLSFPQNLSSLRDTFMDFKRMALKLVDDGRKSWIEESLDMSALKEIGWDGCVVMLRAIMSVTMQIQMPIRKKETEVGWRAFETIDSPGSMIDAIKYVYHCLKTAEIDYHGLKILLVSRVLNENASIFLAGKFRGLLDKGVITLERTRAWVVSSVKTSIEVDQSIIRDLKPLTSLGAKKVLFAGLVGMLLGLKLLHNEHDFPETYLFDVWRLCSLQRKLRIDASALCVIPGLRRWLVGVNLLETDNGRLALERVTKLFLSVDYGMRGPGDFSSNTSTLPSNSTLPKQLRDELISLFPAEGENLASRLSAGFDIHCPLFKNIFDGFARMMKRPVTSVDDKWGIYAESECEAIISRAKKNIAVIQRTFSVNTSIHLIPCLNALIADEVAKLP